MTRRHHNSLDPLRPPAIGAAGGDVIAEEERVTAKLPKRKPAQGPEQRMVRTIVSTLRTWQEESQQESLKQLQHQQQIVLDTVSRLAESEARAELVIETAPDAFIGIDLHGSILNWNAQATEMFGWSREEAIGSKLWAQIIPAVFHDTHVIRTPETDRPRITHRVELLARHRDGHEFPVEITISGPLQTDAGDFFGAFVRDISKRKRREEELAKARESAISQARSLEILNGISRELSGLLNPDELLERIGDLLYQLVEYHALSVLLVDATGKKLVPRHWLAKSETHSKSYIPIDQGLVGMAARTRQPVVTADVRKDPLYIMAHEATRSEVSVPLVVKDKLIGVLDVENATVDYFRESHVQAITIFASQLAIALDNAMLYDRVSEHERQLNQDLQFARKIQKRLLMDKLPPMLNANIASLSWPARILGGDVYEFGYYSRSGLHIGLLGDVTGKGAPAALYAALATGIIHQLMEQELFPAEMLKALNCALMERPLESHFVALKYTVWDDVNRRLYLANSGLPKPIRYRAGEMSIIDAVGTPLGLLPGLEFDQVELEVLPGDVFVFLTDGVLEALNEQGEEFGYDGVERVLHASRGLRTEEIKTAIAEALSEHCEGVEAQDDQTLVVFKIRNSASLR
jgi:PAS domain S-box-containing protein